MRLLGWNSAVIDSGPAAYVARLKQEGAGDILLVGGIKTTRSLFLASVVDALPSRSTPWPPRRDGGCSTSPCR